MTRGYGTGRSRLSEKGKKIRETDTAFQQCILPSCGAKYGIDEVLVACPSCGNLVDVVYDWDRLQIPASLADIEEKWSQRSDPYCFSGVWRFHQLLPFAPLAGCVTVGEGQTLLLPSEGVAKYVGMQPSRLFLQYEGMNPSGSFKDNGMSAAFSHARFVGATRAACASTGNTSASLALYCSVTKLMKAVIFVGSGKIAYGKLSQALDYGALTVQITGDFDDAMARVKEVTQELGIYLVNSVNPFRLEGQKTIMYRVLEKLGWEVPDWIVVPGGNLGNSSAFGKAFAELKQLGLIDRVPRLAIINATGADTLTDLVNNKQLAWNGGRVDQKIIDDYYADLTARNFSPHTCASAIEISRPVNLKKCLRAIDVCNGIVRAVSDEEICDAKALIGKYGLGCEPASAATIAGLRHLLADGVIGKDERVACVLTGHLLKDPNVTVNYHKDKQGVLSNPPIEAPNDLQEIIKLIR